MLQDEAEFVVLNFTISEAELVRLPKLRNLSEYSKKKKIITAVGRVPFFLTAVIYFCTKTGTEAFKPCPSGKI